MASRRSISRYTLLIFILVGALLFTACSGEPPAVNENEGEDTETEPETETSSETEEEVSEAEGTASEEEPFKFALVLSAPWDDKSWNQAAYEAMLEIDERPDVETAFTESVDVADAARVLRQYSDEGYQMIVAHSFGYQDATFEVAEEYPDINYAWGGGINRTAENVADFDQPFYEAAYLIGILGAHVSETGNLGALYAFDIPVCHSIGEAMLAGAHTVNSDATVSTSVIGDWFDIAKGKEAALAQADTGVDFWVGCGQSAGEGGIEAAKEAGGYAIGYLGDMTELGPEVVIGNLVWDLEPMFTQMIEDTRNNTFDGPYYRFGVREGAMDLAINPDFMDVIPEEAIGQIEAAKEQIQAGTLEVPFVPE